MDKYLIKNGLSLFWGGPYSQWEIAEIEFEDITFNCNEQMMMFCKALVHDDFESAELIMEELFPDRQKKLGRKVKNFTEEKWTKAVSMACVYIANYCKFSQNEKYKQYLLNDPGHTIVEASPYDKVWGIGLGTEKPQAWNRNSWRGENRLGDCIGMARDMIRDDRDHEDIEHHIWAERIVKGLFDKWKAYKNVER